MYLAIITLPLLGSIVSGVFGRKVGVSGAQLITCTSVIITTLLAIVAFFEVGLNNIPVSVNLFRWIDSESLNVLWGFRFDSLTVSMLLPVLIVSSLVHIYSVSYMSHDPRGRVRGKRVYGDKLSNSGYILKLKVPSCSWKTISGWSNYSGMVTSLKMSENKMDNRGSKSTILLELVSLLIFALSSFISFILSLPVLHLFEEEVLFYSSGFNRRNLSSTSALSVGVRNSGVALLHDRSPLLTSWGPTKSAIGSGFLTKHRYYTNSPAVMGSCYQNATGGKGRKRAEGTGSPRVPIEVFDKETGIKTTYPSMSGVGKALGVPSGSIRMYFSRNTQKPYKGRYLLQKLAGNSLSFHTLVVKEQRVDGSWLIKPHLINLRCTLGGFERNRGVKLGFNMQQGWNSYVKVPSKQFDLKKFSTCSSTIVNPGVWSGLIDGEGSFGITVDRNKTRKLGWRALLKFQIGLHTKDLYLLYLLQQYLGGIGSIHLAQKREIVNYSIDSIEDLNKLIIHLEKYPLLTQKAADFLLFKQAVKLVNNKAHLTVEGLNQIVNIKASMNLGLSEMLKSEFAGYTPVERPVINSDNVNLDPHWISGFVSAEGNFDVRMPSTNSKLGYRVQLRFRISQHSRDLRLMEKIVEYFGSGKIYKYGGKSAVSLTILDFTDITNIIVPFFNKNPIIGIKLYDYLDWCKIHSLMINRAHLTVEGIKSIREIKSGMNTGRSF